MADETKVRMVVPRRWVLAGSAGTVTALAMGRGYAQEAGEGGEGGEGGEAGAAGDRGAAGLLTALGLVEGHLLAGATLSAAGQQEMAVTHMKHPKDEIYTDLEPLLDQYGAPGFADELTALSAAVESGAESAAVAEAHAAAVAKIAAARATASPTVLDEVEAIEALVRTAADEYAVGVVDGQIAELHEYQDAWGFLQVARAQAEVLDAPEEVKAQIAEALAPTEALFAGGLVPDGAVEGDASVLAGAAARVELAGLALH